MMKLLLQLLANGLVNGALFAMLAVGFGLVWRLDTSINKRLGWATDPEEGFQTWTQGYSGMGLHSFYTLMQGVDGTIYHLRVMGNVWQVYSP